MAVNSDIRTLQEMLKSVDESLQTMESLSKMDFEEKGYAFTLMEIFEKYSKEEIEKFSPIVIQNLALKYATNLSDFTTETYDDRSNRVRADLLELWESSQPFISTFNDRQKIAKQVNDAMTDYTAYLNSDEFKENEAKKIDNLKAKITDDPNDKESQEAKRILAEFEASDELTFVFDRINALGDKEVKSVMDSFFDRRRASYIMDKYYAKIGRLDIGLDKNIYRALVNIEETFLGEEYEKFNNLFLFFILRFVAYSDMSKYTDQLFIQTLILAAIKLVYHKLSKEDETKFINIVKKYDDNFLPYGDIFEAKNDSAPNSEYRKNLREQKAKETRQNVNQWCVDHGVLAPDDSLTTEELTQYLKTQQEIFACKEWLNMMDIKYDPEATLEELKALRENKGQEVTEEETHEVEGTPEASVEVEDVESTEQ